MLGLTARQRGFSLIETLMVVSVSIVVLSAAAPAIYQLFDDSKRVARMNELVATIQLARSEAAKRGNDMLICVRDPETDECATGFGARADYPWEQGWLLFDEQDMAAGPVYRFDGWLDDGIRFRGNFASGKMRYSSLGFVSSMGRLVYCNKGSFDADLSHRVVINKTGRPMQEQAEDSGSMDDSDICGAGQ